MKNIKIAIQKKGRLTDETIRYLESKGLEFEMGDRNLIVDIKNQTNCLTSKNISLYLLRNSDIPKLIEDGTCDFGILGLDQVLEQKKNVKIIKKLGFSKCRFSIAIPNESQIKNLEDFDGKTLATSYPNIVKKYFKQKNIDVSVKVLEGSVEIAPKIGLSDGIVDIVSTGRTLKQNNLIELETICYFEAVLITSDKSEKCLKNLIEILFNLGFDF